MRFSSFLWKKSCSTKTIIQRNVLFQANTIKCCNKVIKLLRFTASERRKHLLIHSQGSLVRCHVFSYFMCLLLMMTRILDSVGSGFA